jgi:HEPN domain-containing protein
MPHRHEDWLAQARHDLKAANNSLTSQDYEWSSFQSQQCAEKALKALLRYRKKEMRGHDLPDLIEAVSHFVQVPNRVKLACEKLDAQYFRPRYPDSITDGYPAEFYDEAIAKECVQNAETVLAFVEANIS